MIIQDLSLKLSTYIANELDQEDNQSVINYGLQIFIGAFLKIISLLGFSYILGTFKPTIVLLVSACLFRTISGGAHCSDYWRCFIATHLVFLPLGYISYKFQLSLSLDQQFNLYFFSALILLAVIYLWAPGEHEERSLTVRKKRLSKIFAALFIILIYIWVVIFKYQYGLSVFLGLIWQGFTITPTGYWFMNIIDKLLTFKIREVESC
jgi:accessory gene regulator B